MPYILYNLIQKIKKNPKISLRNFQIMREKARVKSYFFGGFTVEAAIVLPVFLYAAALILSVFQFLFIQQSVQKSLNTVGLEAAIAAASMKENNILPITVGKFFIELKEFDFVLENIQGKGLGMSFSDSQTEGPYIDLIVDYHINAPIYFFGRKSIHVRQRCKIHKWIGEQDSEDPDQEKEWVYITPTGIVYHESRECTHIRLTLKTVPGAMLSTISKTYDPCELCGKRGKIKANLYITEDGRKYHYELNCSGIKRTIYIVERSEAGRRRPCSRCINKK